MTNDLFIKIVGAVITIVISLVSAYVLPAIKSNIAEKDMQTIIHMIEVAVRCADQIYTAEEWRQKKAYVKAFIVELVDKNLHIKLTEQDIDNLIEGIVNEIHHNGIKGTEGEA